jgi:hypothetical protein
MSVLLLKQLLTKELMKESAKRTGIMTINKNLSKDVEKLLQKYISSAQSQGVDLDTLGEQQLKYIIQLNKPKTPQLISADSPEGQDMTKKLMSFLDRQSGDNVVDITGKKIDTSQGIMGGKSVKELMESGQVQKGTDGLKKGQKITDRDMFNNSSLNQPGETNIFSNKYLNDLDKKIIDSDAFGYSQKEWNNLSNSSKEKFRKQFDSNYEDAMENTQMAPIKTIETDAQIKARLDAGNKKSSTNIKNNRQLTDEEIRDYELELGDSETWLNKGTFGEAEQALKNQKAYEAKMFKEYKSIGGSKRPGGPKASERDSMPIRLMKNFEKELNEADLMAEGYSKDQANVLIKARKKMTSGDEMNPNESLLRVKEEFADNAGVDVEDFTDIDFEIDIPEYATGGRAGYYGGGQAMVGEDLSEIGHGSDSLMARNMQLAPNSMATTSTGLNYLLGQDNDTARVPYDQGGPARQNFAMGKRAFLKFLASGAAGIAGLKTGLFGVGKKEAAKEVAKEVATSGSGGVPPYFLKLVKKIKNLGDDVTETNAVADRQKVTRYKDFELTEDVSTGRVEIQRVKVAEDMDYYGSPVTEETFMGYSPAEEIFQQTAKGKTKIIKTQPKYEEGTTYLRNDGPNTGNVLDETSGLSDDIFKEVGEEVPEIIRKTKADGGRIGYSGGGILKAIIAKSAASKGLSVRDFIKATSYKGLPREVKMYISAEDFAKLKGGQKEMYDNFIDMAKTRKAFQENVEGGKGTPVAPLFRNLEKTMDEQSFVPKTVTADDIAEMELMVRNRFEKGRKLNATGGIATMLGE